MNKKVSILSEGLGHPEGPYVLPDGRVVFANTYRSEIGVWDPKKGTGSYAFTGGAPNACMLGSDGHVYITNCPTVGKWLPEDKRPPSIQRAPPDGKVEVVCSEADGVTFTGRTTSPSGRTAGSTSPIPAIGIRRRSPIRAASSSSRRTAPAISWKSWTTSIPTASLPSRTAPSSGSNPIRGAWSADGRMAPRA